MDLLQTVRKEGSRGGRSEFSWSDVQGDAQRENYLGHSLMAPVGRWQKGRDLNWYAKGDNPAGEEAEKSAADKRKEEIRRVKEREEDEMRKALGLDPIERGDTNANMMPLGPGRDDKEVQKILREVAQPDEEDETAVKGLGHGSAVHSGGDNKEVMKGRDDRKSGGQDRRRRSRSREHRHKRRDDEDRPRRRRSRSRDRSRDREREHRRHRSRSRDYKHRSRRDSRERDDRPRREERRERSRDGERRRHRSRSPDDRRDRDRDRDRRRRYD